MSKHRLVELTAEQRQQLTDLTRTGAEKARTIARARILLLADRADRSEHGGNRRMTDQQVAEALQCSKGTVQSIRHRFLDEGLVGALTERPRPGAPTRPKITGKSRRI